MFFLQCLALNCLPLWGEFFAFTYWGNGIAIEIVGTLWVDGSSLKLMEHNMTFLKYKALKAI